MSTPAKALHSHNIRTQLPNNLKKMTLVTLSPISARAFLREDPRQTITIQGVQPIYCEILCMGGQKLSWDLEQLGNNQDRNSDSVWCFSRLIAWSALKPNAKT